MTDIARERVDHRTKDHGRDQVAKQTALFFGFVTAAMTYASAQTTPVNAAPAPTAQQQSVQVGATDAPAERKAAVRRAAARG